VARGGSGASGFRGPHVVAQRAEPLIHNRLALVLDGREARPDAVCAASRARNSHLVWTVNRGFGPSHSLMTGLALGC
jgi:hypothetical protein